MLPGHKALWVSPGGKDFYANLVHFEKHVAEQLAMQREELVYHFGRGRDGGAHDLRAPRIKTRSAGKNAKRA